MGPGFCRITLAAPAIASLVEPGQFVQIFMPQEHPHMLPRPFSVHKADPENGIITILVEIKGQGSRLLASREPGSFLKLLGPLGNGFPPPPPGSILVAGGMGVAPLAFLAESVKYSRTLLYCARTADLLICPEADFNIPGLQIMRATDDGTAGFRGTAADLLSGCIAEAPAVFACGPRPMLVAVKEICLKRRVRAWLSLEERMACGVGACVGCVVPTIKGYKRVCRDGPVFPAEEVILDG